MLTPTHAPTIFISLTPIPRCDPERSAAIRLNAGRSPSEHVAHVIDAPRRLWIERTVGGAESALAIESSDGSRTTVRFKTAALPETVDSVAGWP